MMLKLADGYYCRLHKSHRCKKGSKYVYLAQFLPRSGIPLAPTQTDALIRSPVQPVASACNVTIGAGRTALFSASLNHIYQRVGELCHRGQSPSNHPGGSKPDENIADSKDPEAHRAEARCAPRSQPSPHTVDAPHGRAPSVSAFASRSSSSCNCSRPCGRSGGSALPVPFAEGVLLAGMFACTTQVDAHLPRSAHNGGRV